MQYIVFSEAVTIKKINQLKNFDVFNIIAQNIDCGNTLEPPCQDVSNQYTQSMFRIKNKKNRCTPVYPSL